MGNIARILAQPIGFAIGGVGGFCFGYYLLGPLLSLFGVL